MQSDIIGNAESDAMSIREASHRLGIGRTKVYELLNLGIIAAFKVGRRTLVKRASLEAFIEHPPTPYRGGPTEYANQSETPPGTHA